MEDKLLQLDPTKILAEDNIRFGITRSAVDELKDSIKALGGIQTPVIVERLDPPTKTHTHRLTVGFNRHLAVLELNTQEKAGLTLPAIERVSTDRFREQLSENLNRKNLSPMDLASAIKKAFDSGLTRMQVRELFPRPTGKKGTPEPASNAWVNMTLSFLDLPKAIQTKIHEGTVGVKAAYELTKVSPDKRAAVLERAEGEAEKEREREQAEEKKYLAAEAKVETATKAAQEVAVKLDESRAEVELAEKLVETVQRKAADAYVKAKAASKDDKKKAEEAFRAAETDAKGAEKKLVEAKKALAKLQGTSEKASKLAEDTKAKLEEARKTAAAAKGKKKTGVSDTDVKKAAKAEGEGSGHVQLNATDMRKTIADLALPGTYPKVQLIGAAIKQCFDGITTPGQMLKALAKITGEAKK